jgi:hypothetical protein
VWTTVVKMRLGTCGGATCSSGASRQADARAPALTSTPLPAPRCYNTVHRPHCLAKLKQPSYLPWATGGERHMAGGAVAVPAGGGPWRLSSCTQNGQVLTISTLIVASELLNAV